MENTQTPETPKSFTGTAGKLEVEKRQLSASFLGVSLSLLVLIIMADYLVITIWDNFSAASDALQDTINYRRIRGIVYIPVFLVVLGNIYTVTNLFNRGFSEILLGIVSLDFSGRGKVIAAVSITPMAKVFIESISLKLTVVKEISHGSGKNKRKLEQKIFEETNTKKRDCDGRNNIDTTTHPLLN